MQEDYETIWRPGVSRQDWSRCHSGLFHTPFAAAGHLMPEIAPMLEEFRLVCELEPEDYTIDAKVHMLMPGQYPCIPNWHFDMVPRDEEGYQDFTRVREDLKLYLWLSGPPLTEFEDEREVTPGKWIPFTQLDGHRGAPSQAHKWRCFIRACPAEILPAAPSRKWLRRHSQVYLDADQFTW